MARPRSDEKREAILKAAIAMIAEHGLGASTSLIAKKAGVSHGTLFIYFGTKDELFNALYLHLKDELNEVVLANLPEPNDTREQLHHLWTRWMEWGTSRPASRRALAQLSVSEQVTEKSRVLSAKRSAVGIEVVGRATATGVLKDQSIDFVGAIFDAFAGTTMDFMIRDPKRAETYRESAFEALWNALQ